VPGHGPIGMAESLKVMSQYVSTLDRLARKMVEEGEAEETIDRMAVPEPYNDWLFGSFFPGNMHFLYQRHLRAQGNEGEEGADVMGSATESVPASWRKSTACCGSPAARRR
jgi:hypothetical protein